MTTLTINIGRKNWSLHFNRGSKLVGLEKEKTKQNKKNLHISSNLWIHLKKHPVRVVSSVWPTPEYVSFAGKEAAQSEMLCPNSEDVTTVFY